VGFCVRLRGDLFDYANREIEPEPEFLSRLTFYVSR
jgi:hypothetical protein